MPQGKYAAITETEQEQNCTNTKKPKTTAREKCSIGLASSDSNHQIQIIRGIIRCKSIMKVDLTLLGLDHAVPLNTWQI